MVEDGRTEHRGAFRRPVASGGKVRAELAELCAVQMDHRETRSCRV